MPGKYGFLAILAICTGLLILGCSGANEKPVTPSDRPESAGNGKSSSSASQTHLWGYWDIRFDFENMEVTAIPNRHAMFTANLTRIMNNNPPMLSFSFNGITPDLGFVDIDLDVTIAHPFPDLPEYNGYDVRGIFMGNGSGTFAYNSKCRYPVKGIDQFMMNNPVTGVGGPDGYTRWFNQSEFDGSMPLVSYHPGNYASNNFSGTATVNPYRYFADGLNKNSPPYKWLTVNTDSRGVFSSGSKNKRNYYLRFPQPDPSIRYGYGVIANWEGVAPEFHPDNAREAIAVEAVDAGELYYVDETVKGGNIKVEVSVFDWMPHSLSGVMEDYTIFIETPLLNEPYRFTPDDMTPILTGNNSFTYCAEIPPDNLTQSGEFPIWIIVESEHYDYTNKFGVPNTADTDKLAAFFEFSLTVSDVDPCPPPVVVSIEPDHAKGGDILTGVSIQVADLKDGPSLAVNMIRDGFAPIPATNVEYKSSTALTCDFDLKWAAKGFWGIEVISGCGSPPGTAFGLFEITYQSGRFVWAKQAGGNIQDMGIGVEKMSDDSIMVVGIIQDKAVFAEGEPNETTINCLGMHDFFIARYDEYGSLIWVKREGGIGADYGMAVTVFNDDSFAVTGAFSGTVIFSQGEINETVLVASGTYDFFIARYNSDGTLLWAKRAGGSENTGGAVIKGLSDNSMVVIGNFRDSVVFGEGEPNETTLVSKGLTDVFFARYGSDGAFLWAISFGGIHGDSGGGITVLSDDSAVVTGSFHQTVVFGEGEPNETTLVSESGTDMFIARYNPDGTLVWVKSSYGAGSSRGYGITTLSDDSMAITGSFSDTVILGKGEPNEKTLVSAGDSDIFIARYNADG
ncbi:MAG TPA: hypothetical protein ENN67_04700, partial [Firmicutes bacterium]|nr:hypothetical protein [Bacillota bacterium]